MQDMNFDNDELKEKNVKVRRLLERKMQQLHQKSSVPCLLDVRATSILSEFLLNEHVLKALK